jgi:hypothetical protein
MKTEELETWSEVKIKETFRQNKLLKKKPEKILKDIIDNKISLNDLPWNSFYREIFANQKPSIDLDLLKVILKNKCEDILENKEYLRTLKEITKYKEFWVKDVKNWKRNSRNVHKQIENLIEFLFLKYKTPKFLNNCWFENNNNNINNKKLFLHIASGQNVRTFESLPFPLTKRMAYEFINAPSDYTITEAFMWAIVKFFGGDERLVQIMNGTIILPKIEPPKTNLEEKNFWITIIEFFVKNPMISPEKISPIIDYIENIKFIKERIWVDGILRLSEPEQPNFVIKGKNIEKLIEKTEEWHNKLNKENKLKNFIPKNWKGYQIDDFRFEEGKDSNRKIYHIYQLLNQSELSQEGKAMNHCVFSYAKSCANGTCSIWSLRYNDSIGNTHRMVTIELRGDSIVQIRGKHNRKVEQKEMYIIEKWATKEGLKISRWC